MNTSPFKDDRPKRCFLTWVLFVAADSGTLDACNVASPRSFSGTQPTSVKPGTD